MTDNEQRYFRWRDAIRRPIWCLDQHWYALLGRLYPAPQPSVMDVFSRVARRELTPEEGARLLHEKAGRARNRHPGERWGLAHCTYSG